MRRRIIFATVTLVLVSILVFYYVNRVTNNKLDNNDENTASQTTEELTLEKINSDADRLLKEDSEKQKKNTTDALDKIEKISDLDQFDTAEQPRLALLKAQELYDSNNIDGANSFIDFIYTIEDDQKKFEASLVCVIKLTATKNGYYEDKISKCRADAQRYAVVIGVVDEGTPLAESYFELAEEL